MAKHREPLSGGLVTIRDPALLSSGQLSSLRNAVFKPGSDAIHRATGRSAFGTASAATDVVGLRDLQFDNSLHLLVAHASSFYLSAAVGDTGTFGTLASGVGVGSQLEVVQYRNRFFLMNGSSLNATATAVNTNLVTYLSATGASVASTRQHGMNAVIAPVSSASTAGTFSQTVTGYYEYWTTELAKLTQDNADFLMESTFAGTPVTVNVSSTALVPIISRPDIRNPSVATHWRVYRSPKKDKENDKKFPIGFMVGEISTAASSMSDTQTTLSASGFPANMNGVGDGATVYSGFSNAVRLSADDNSDATAASTSLVDRKSQGVYGFNFGGFSGVVQGIKVEVEALTNTGVAGVEVRLVRGRQTDGGFIPGAASIPPLLRDVYGEAFAKLNTVAKSFVATTSRTVYTLGGTLDRWFPLDHAAPFRDSDFSSANFMVVISFAAGTAITLSVDYVKVTVYYGGSIDSVVPFPTVVYTFGDISAQVGKNGPPPSSNAGDIFEDTLVVNDVSNPAVIRYSYPGDPEAFPATYYVDFETRDNDRVTAIKTVNNRLMVWLNTSTWRVNYLPSERDASFDRGKSKDPVSSQYGCVNPMCVALFSRDGGSEEVAWVSDKGIHSSDGFSFNTRTGQLDWRSIISTTSTSTPIALIDDPENQRLSFYFRNDTYTPETYLRLDLSYAKGDIDEEGNFKAGGFVHMRNYSAAADNYAALTSAWPVRRSTGDTNIYMGYGGTVTAAGAGSVYRDTGTSLPVKDDTMKFSTRDLFLAGEGKEWRASELYFFTGSYTGAPAITFTPKTTKTNDTAGRVTQGSKSRTLGGEKLSKVQFNQIAESMVIDMQATASALQMEYLLVDGEGFGDEDSGK